MANTFPRGTELGFVSGLAATAPMTVAMELMRYTLLGSRRGTFPPQQVTSEMLRKTGLDRVHPRSGIPLHLTTTLAHIGFGATAGALFGLTEVAIDEHLKTSAAHRSSSRSVQDLQAAGRGAAFGLCVWMGSYFGWLPALGIIEPQGDYPFRKNIILASSHLVWGAAAGLIFRRMTQKYSGAPRSRVQRKSRAASPRAPVARSA